jgi:hypothetical protein
MTGSEPKPGIQAVRARLAPESAGIEHPFSSTINSASTAIGTSYGTTALIDPGAAVTSSIASPPMNTGVPLKTIGYGPPVGAASGRAARFVPAIAIRVPGATGDGSTLAENF